MPRAPHDEDGGHWICFGGLTRSVGDAALMLEVMAPGVGTWTPRPLRIAYSEAFPPLTTGKLDDEVRDALRGTAGLLKDLGHEVIERDLDLKARDMPVIVSLLMRGIRDIVADVALPQRLERRTRAIARPGALVGDRLVERLLAAEENIARRIGRLWEEFDVLLMPIFAADARPAMAMEGRGAFATWQWESAWVPFGVLFNSTGQPAASVPAGFSSKGLPLAVQLVGAPHDERTLLGLAGQIEAARSWLPDRPSAFDC